MVRLDGLIANDAEAAFCGLDRNRAGDQTHPVEIEQLDDRLARGRAEQLERLGLRRHELDRHAAGTGVCEVHGRQERKLVERKRPRHPGGHREDDAPGAPFAGGAEDLSESGLVLGAAERERARDRLDRLRAEGDQQLVVRELSGRRLDDLPIRVDRSRGRPGKGGSRLGDQL